MEDLIRRSDAIKGAKRLHNLFSSPFYNRDRVKTIEAYFNDIPSADRWIPCSERLPKRQGFYICTCKDGSKYKRTTFVKWSNGWQLTGTRSYWIVLAWMPLPEAWEGADDEQS